MSPPKTSSITNLFSKFHHTIQNINQSKIFAGLVVVTLNISSKFVTVKLSKSMESYLKHTFSRDVLIFCIVWMGSREIYVALILTLIFILCMDFLFNEESRFCILPESFQQYHLDLLDNATPSQEDIKNARNILERAGNTNVGTTQKLQGTSNTNITANAGENDDQDNGFLQIKW
jgi:hypothetical protein